MDTPRCPVCGSEEIVDVVSETDGGQLRQFCQRCERLRNLEERGVVRYLATRSAHLLICAGVILAMLTVAADHLAISGRAGFGWRQITGAEVGFLCIFLSLLLRRGALLGTLGLFLLVLSLGADLLQVGHAPGFGWRTHLAFVLAIVLLATGVLWRRSLKKRALTLPSAKDNTGLSAS